MAFGVHGGLNKYWGTFTDNQFWYGGDVFFRWNIIPYISFHTMFGLSQIRVKVNETNIRSNPAYFGEFDPANGLGIGQGVYPGTTINREEKNAIRVNTYSAIVSYNITPNQKLIPYVFGGIGMMNWEPKNLNQQASLPNNLNGVYDKTKLYFPVGFGVELYLTDNFVANVKGQLHITGTDYLDDYAEEGTSDDAFGLFAIGASYYIFGSLDCDKDGLTDSEEKAIGTDPCNIDTDGDQLTDFEEVRTYRTDPLKSDTDGDNLGDFAELRTHMTDPRLPDTDSDGLQDGQEIARKTDPKNPDTDGDTLTDGDEVNTYKTDPIKSDTDGDGLADGDEIKVHSTNPLAADTDSDNLRDGDEINRHKTDPKNADTDGDELRDGDEVNQYTTNPTQRDTDNDKLTDGEEVNRVKTNPKDPDTDDDTVIDGDDQCPFIKGVAERNGCPAPPKVGTITNFPAIYFVVNTDEFDFSRPETDESLAQLLSYINQCPGLGVIIEGHASREGAEKRNQELSEMRANKVKAWLIDRGIDPNKVEATFGYGSRRNAVEEPDPKSKEARAMNAQALEEIRRQNRRIAVKVVRTCE